MLDLTGGLDADLVHVDRAIYGPEFSAVTVSTGLDALREGPFDIVHVFSRDEGKSEVAGMILEDFVTALSAAKPKLVILASPNSARALRPIGRLPFNLIATSERKGDSFASFFRKLFRSMFEGTGLAYSWVRLSPQDEGPGRDDEPVLLCVPGQPGLFFATAG